MKNKKGFTLVELLVSFALITAISLAFFRTILSLQQEQLKNIAKNNYKAFTIVLNNSIQKDFLNDNIEKIISCGDSCYDITYTKNGIVRLSLDKEKKIITYGNIKEKLPADYKFIGDIEFTSYINSYDGNDSYIALNINVKSTYEKGIDNIKYVYQYDSDNEIIELDVDGAEASDIIEYLLYKSPEENGLYEPLLPDGTSTGIRYRGENPNNYVYFNCEDTYNDISYGEEGYDYENACEVWRIIGVFDVDNGKGNVEKRVGLIKNEVLSTNKEWDTSDGEIVEVNQWGKSTLTSDNTTPYLGASLMQYLNEDYYNSMTSVAKGQIDDALWSTGILIFQAMGPSTAYRYERENTKETVTQINYTTKWTGKIGLIYPSDYGYASLDKTCHNNIFLISCTNSNWLSLSTNSYWTIISMNNYDNGVYFIDKNGNVATTTVNSLLYVRPSLYLKSNVTFVGDGNGTEESPYILGINE